MGESQNWVRVETNRSKKIRVNLKKRNDGTMSNNITKCESVPFLRGENLRRMRRERGLSLEELAEEIALTSVHIFAWEEGESSMPFWVLLECAKVLECSYSELLDGVAPPASQEEAQNAISWVTENHEDIVENGLGLCLDFRVVVAKYFSQKEIDQGLRQIGVYGYKYFLV